MSSKDGRSEKATPQRRKKARDEGQVPRTQEAGVAASFVGMLTVAAIAGRMMVETASGDLRGILLTAGAEEALVAAAPRALSLGAILAGPFLFGAVIVGLIAGISQVGVKFNGKLLKPKANRLSIKQGLERFKPKQAAWELFRTVLKLGAVFVVVWPSISSWREHIQNDRTLAGAMDRLSGVFGGIILRATILAIVIALLDFTYQKLKNDQKIMMSRQDIKREFRDSEGDPYQKAARRRRQQDFSRNRMMKDVATADVLVANPTHVVVALRYDPAEGAPRVVAKGADLVADKLKTVARRNGVPITVDIPLARTLFRRCKVGHHIPTELYEAVAIVLAMAYRRTGRSPGSRAAASAARSASATRTASRSAPRTTSTSRQPAVAHQPRTGTL